MGGIGERDRNFGGWVMDDWGIRVGMCLVGNGPCAVPLQGGGTFFCL